MPAIVRILPEHAALYRRARLAALQDTPTAFCSTYAGESLLTHQDWLDRATRLDGIHRIGFLALDGDEPCGLMAAFQDERDPSMATVISVWVSPSHRGTGLSRSMLSAIHDWAQSRDLKTLQLMVTDSNHQAIAFYRRFGFTPTGVTEPYVNDPALTELEMSCSIFPR